MFPRKFTLFLFLTLSFPAVFFARTPSLEAGKSGGERTQMLLDQVVAVVNDEAITQSELDILLRPLYQQFRREYKGDELITRLNEARRKLLNQLIEDRLVFQEATKQNIQVDEDEIDERMKEFEKRFKSQLQMEEALKKEGLIYNNMRERIQRQLVIRRLHDTEIRAKVAVSPLEVEGYYQNHPEEFTKQERIRLRSITIRKSELAREKGLTDEAAKKKIEGLRQEVKGGKDFATLAKENSEDSNAEQGGLTDWVERGMMIAAIDEVIFKLKPQEVSEIVETPLGYHCFRLEERQDGQKLTLDQSREAVFAKIFEEKAQERYREWMEELKRSAYISIR